MSNPVRQKIISIVGPTASGKSKLAVSLAKKIGGEIISADSRQVYRGMDLGTGKIKKREMQGIPHHLLDIASPRITFTAARYRTLARKVITTLGKKKKTPIVVGGTGFYLDALMATDPLPDVKPNMALRKKLEQKTAEELFRELKKKDPRRAATIDPHNKRRLVRALEILAATKRPIQPRSAMKNDYDLLKIGINPAAKTLRKNIHTRLLARMKQGMVAEVRTLHENGLSWKRLDELGLEYRFVARYLQGQMAKPEMISKLETEIRHYAKRQMTWFKKDPTIRWVRNEKEAITEAKKFLKYIDPETSSG